MSSLDLFIDMMKAERAAPKNTVESYERDLQDLAKFLKKTPLERAKEADLRRYLINQSKRHMASSTIARRLSAMRQFYQFLSREGDRKDNPSSKLTTPKQTKSLPKYLSIKQVDNLITTSHKDTTENGLRLTSMLELLYASGLRVSELVSLKQSAFQEHTDENGAMRYFLHIRGKGDKERLVPMHQAAIDAVERYKNIKTNKTSYLFPSDRSKSGHITRQRMGQLLKALAVEANLPPEKLSPHIIRHSFATHLLEKNIDLRVLQELLGHSNIATTEIYTHISSKQLYDLVNKAHPLAKKP